MPSTIEFDFKELSAMRHRFETAPEAVVKISLNDGMRAIARLFVPAKGTGPLAQATPKVSGKLARSTFFQITGAPKRQILRIMQPARSPEGAFYGEYVREGTEPHEIRPVKAKALRWFDAGGQPIFAMLVHHPGNKPNPYHHRTMAKLRPQVQRLVTRMGERVTAYLSGKGA